MLEEEQILLTSLRMDNLWRRERDLNPRVQWTVDFKSTAIPGYAISAVFIESPIRDELYNHQL